LQVPFDFEADTPLRIAEYMAFNFQKETPGFGWNGGFRELIWAHDQFRYFDFFKQNDARYYRGARSLADVAILRGYASMANNNSSVHRATVLGEQVLIQNRIPFHIVFDQHLQRLHDYRVLLLTEQECLSDRDLKKILSFVEAGGAVVATGTTATFDAWRRRRPGNGLAAALGFQAGTATVRGTFGKGRFAYIPAVIPAGQGSDDRAILRDRELSADAWRLPANTAEIVETLRWAAGGPFTAEIHGPPTLVSEATEDGSHRLRLIHLLNYDAGHPAGHITVDLAFPAPVKSVTVLSPDRTATGPIPFQQQNGRLKFQVDTLQTYSLVVVTAR
jgi:hypothetical protein